MLDLIGELSQFQNAIVWLQKICHDLDEACRPPWPAEIANAEVGDQRKLYREEIQGRMAEIARRKTGKLGVASGTRWKIPAYAVAELKAKIEDVSRTPWPHE